MQKLLSFENKYVYNAQDRLPSYNKQKVFFLLSETVTAFGVEKKKTGLSSALTH